MDMKHVLWYLQGTMDYGMEYIWGNGVKLIGCTISDWEGTVGDRKSISRFFFMLGSIVVS